MGNLALKQQTDRDLDKNGKPASDKANKEKKFVLYDVSPEELKRRRVPVYPYIM